MIPRGIGLWLPSALLLSGVPGCVPLRGPSSVTRTVGESLVVWCQYEEKYKMNEKYWCRRSLVLLCENIIKTGVSEEARNGRVSIRDHPDSLIFTVIFQKLTLEDTGTYMCGVDTPFTDDSLGIDKFFKIELSVVPGSSPGSSTKIQEPTTSSPVDTQPSVTTNDNSCSQPTASVSSKQPLLLHPGVSGVAPVPVHALCCPVGEQGSEVLWVTQHWALS